ncbi:MAG: hypothetical protein KAR19_03855 [Bacteroidales bacterium]|nr:hypothetical protein [Bacteroidales bacterium]
MKTSLMVMLLFLIPLLSFAQPETPVDQWKGKTILLIGADHDGGTGGTYGRGVYAV